MNVPHPSVFQRVFRAIPAQLFRSWYMFFFQLPFLPEAMSRARCSLAIGRAFRGMAVDKSAFPDSMLAHYRENASKPGALTAMINYYRANFTRLASKQNTPKINVPVLMIWGEEDTALGLELT